MKKKIVILISFIILFHNLNAQQLMSQAAAFDTLSLEDLMNIKITVASIKELTARQSPAIISYITADDIRNFGSRDLMEVLQHIPGFEFGVDEEGVVGLAVRGNWAHEGKAVLLIDGQEMNDGLYSTLQFGNHYPIENIERIEIIRGPGSALYGGNAAYAVINVISRTVQNKTEMQAFAFYGASTTDFSRRGANLFLGKKAENKSLSIQAFASQAQRSHSEYKDVYGDSILLNGNSDLNNIYLNVGSSIGHLGIRAIADLYKVESYDQYQAIGKKPLYLHFDSYLGEINYEYKITDHLRIIPKVNFRYQIPWAYDGNDNTLDSTDIPFEKSSESSERYSASILSEYDPNEQFNVTVGVSYFYDRSKNLIEGENFITTNTSELTYNNASFFLQGLYKVRNYNLLGGVRFNNNSRYASTLVPRIGITREFNKVNFKALYSRSFRSPSTENIDLSNNIKPEVTNVYEFETGYSINEYSYVTLNAYEVKTNDPIIYYFDTITNSDAYKNIEFLGTRGLELSYLYKRYWGGIDIGASYYKAKDLNQKSSYSIPNELNQHLGLAPFKGDISIKYLLNKNLNVSSSTTFYSKKYQIASVDNNGNAIYSRINLSALMNLQFDYHFKKIKGLSSQFTIYNLLNTAQWFVQPYNSYHAPLPGMQREFQIKISYQNF